MRVAIRTLSVAAALWLCACEDGPKQIYTAAPSGAGTHWNDGQTAPVVDPASAGFGSQTGGTNKQEICTGEQKAARWAEMVRQPIVPPRVAAGIDLAGGNDWHGITVEEA